MKIIKPSHEIKSMADPDYIMEQIEEAARNCYNSGNLICEGSAESMIKSLLKSGHETPIEFADITVKFICDRGVMSEITRHRLASFCIQSTRYCNFTKDKFGKETTVILPLWCDIQPGSYDNFTDERLATVAVDDIDWFASCLYAEKTYIRLVNLRGWTPEQARSVLNNSLATEIYMKANIREWMHILNLRCSKHAHPQIRELLMPLLEELYSELPVIFGDIYHKYN